MLSLGTLAFATPAVLAALVVLPVIWWLLRVTPPSPRLIAFPAIRLLRDLIAREETPARTPLWLVILRLVLAALVIVALARPLLNPQADLPGSGPLILVVDNGWAAGRDWPARVRAMEDAVEQADREGRKIILLTTAPNAAGERPQASGLLRAAEARRIVEGLVPHPWATDRKAALDALGAVDPHEPAHALWLSDGLGGDGAAVLAERLQRMGDLRVLVDGPDHQPHLLLPPTPDATELTAKVVRADPSLPEPVTVRATAADGRLLARETVSFAAGAHATEARLKMPVELRNEATRLQLENETTAGATVLLDGRWRRRPVGLVSGREQGESQPLLSDLYYLHRALAPYAEVREGSITDLLAHNLAVLMLADVGSMTDTETQAIEKWVDRGGVLVRFAGPRLAQNADTLVPVHLRRGDRALGGAMSWSEPARLAPFDDKSPFAGLAIPADVTVSRQVLAEPSLDLGEKTWARLVDGTPLVTAEKRGNGRIVLVHTTANSDWSNLSLSGLFVEMLRRVVATSEGVVAAGEAATLEPFQVLDGFGRLEAPPASVLPISGADLRNQPIGPSHPPGYYGSEEARRALNLPGQVSDVTALGPLPTGVAKAGYVRLGEVDLKPWLLAAAFALAFIDLVVALGLRGLLRPPRAQALGRRIPASSAAGAVLLAVVLPLLLGSAAGRAADANSAQQAATNTYLAYVITGDDGVDEESRTGLRGLSEALARRTALEPAGAQGVDIETDELAFFPLLYWPVTPGQPPLSDRARERLNAYMRNGGTIVFDTRDQQFGASSLGGGGPGAERLRELVAGLDIPPLAPVPPDHVLTKSFYLMQEFPGRFAGGDVWVEAKEASNDGVSPVIIGSNDWAGAWAIDDNGMPLNAVVPGGERQREMAFRTGINLVMYALTGNYKADQVHVPAILERLGQ